MASSTVQFTVRVTVSQEHLGSSPDSFFLVVCELCGKTISEHKFVGGYDLHNKADLHYAFMQHLLSECERIPECKKAECRYMRHLGECFNDGGTR